MPSGDGDHFYPSVRPDIDGSVELYELVREYQDTFFPKGNHIRPQYIITPTQTMTSMTHMINSNVTTAIITIYMV